MSSSPDARRTESDVARVRQAIVDPGSVLPRRHGEDSNGWIARAVLAAVEAVPLSRVRELEAKVRELHKALSEGYGVEDGGVWEDRAVAAEAREARLRTALERLHHLGAAPGSMDRNEIAAECARVAREALSGGE